MNSPATPGVLCCGNLVRDILVGPVAETLWGRTVWVESINEDFGGNGANTSFALAKLGAPVRLVGMLGADEAGERVATRLKSVGVDMDYVQRCPLPTPTSVVLVNPNGARALLHRPGASREAFTNGFDLTPEMTSGCRWFHLANVFALPGLRSHAGDVLRKARGAGLSVSVDTGWDARGQWMEVLAPCLPHTDVLFVNEDEARELTGLNHPIEAARALQAHGVRNVVVKLGAAGCALFLGEESVAAPGFQVSVVDTTGAGDCFVGAFLAALLRGLSYVDAANLANAVGALSVQKLGSTAGLMSFEQTVAWIKAQQTSA